MESKIYMYYAHIEKMVRKAKNNFAILHGFMTKLAPIDWLSESVLY